MSAFDAPPAETAARAAAWPITDGGWLVRHGESSGNVAGMVQGQSGGHGLTAAGHGQAAALAETFPTGLAVRVYVSDLPRTRLTAGPLAARLRLRPVPVEALRERNLGVLEGTPWSDADPAATGIAGDVVCDPDASPVGGESIADLASRVLAALEEIVERHRGTGVRPVVVTHGGPIRVALARQAGIPLLGLRWDAVPHAQPLPYRGGAELT